MRCPLGTYSGCGKSRNAGEVIRRKLSSKAFVNGSMVGEGTERRREEDMVDVSAIDGGGDSIWTLVGHCDGRIEGVWRAHEEVKN